MRSPAIVVSFVAFTLSFVAVANAQSALDRLSGFDKQRLQAAFPPADAEAVGELAKLIYRLRSIDQRGLAQLADQGSAEQIGDASAFDGNIVRLQAVKISADLIEFLEFDRLYVIEFEAQDERTQRLIAGSLPPEAAVGDRISGTGVVIAMNGGGEVAALAAARPSWFPAAIEDTGRRLLSQAGLDISQLSDAASRSRQPLTAEDGDLFYSLLAVADAIEIPGTDDRGTDDRGTDETSATNAEAITPIQLLSDPNVRPGRLVRIPVETVQITRVSISEAFRQQQLGSDHYYQIDAMADLGEVVVKIERPAGEPGPPAVFENRFPVSVVSRTLPEFLKQQIAREHGEQAVLVQHRSLIEVEGFFYRLWSYESEFMNQFGGGDQIAPLLVAADLQDRRVASEDPIGVRWIGWLAAAAVILAILAIGISSRLIAVRDRAAREKRLENDPQRVDLPDLGDH